MGNPLDASARLVDAIQTSDLIAAEDTRRFRQLANRLGVPINGRVISYFEGNEQDRIEQILDAVAAGEQVLVVSDAGMPSVSDPGYRLVRAAIDSSVDFTVLPGPSAVVTALVHSGLPSDRFTFEGFLPRKAGERRAALNALIGEKRTMIFFEAPHRIGASLADMEQIFGYARKAAVCRELTKTYEEVVRGPLSELVQWAHSDVKGEITVVVAGVDPDELRARAGLADMDSILARVQALVDQGQSLKDAASVIAREAGLSKREVYQGAIDAKAMLKGARERD
jgi:16S rRNA (cytidine1402-2'-O)-methyltransferase